MASSQIADLRAKAQELIKKAKKLEEQGYVDLGKFVADSIKNNQFNETQIIEKAKSLGLVNEE